MIAGLFTKHLLTKISGVMSLCRSINIIASSYPKLTNKMI